MTRVPSLPKMHRTSSVKVSPLTSLNLASARKQDALDTSFLKARQEEELREKKKPDAVPRRCQTLVLLAAEDDELEHSTFEVRIIASTIDGLEEEGADRDEVRKEKLKYLEKLRDLRRLRERKESPGDTETNSFSYSSRNSLGAVDDMATAPSSTQRFASRLPSTDRRVVTTESRLTRLEARLSRMQNPDEAAANPRPSWGGRTSELAVSDGVSTRSQRRKRWSRNLAKQTSDINPAANDADMIAPPQVKKRRGSFLQFMMDQSKTAGTPSERRRSSVLPFLIVRRSSRRSSVELARDENQSNVSDPGVLLAGSLG